MKKSTVSLSFFLTLLLVSTFGVISTSGQIYHVPLNERVSVSEVILEGEVVSKTSFWDDNHHNIYTANVIEVYKVFKGNLTSKKIQIITEGGTVGDKRDVVSHSLQLEIGDIGMFTCIPNKIRMADSGTNPGMTSYQTYAAEQGFLRYDLDRMTATDIFNEYKDITGDVYPAITSRTNRNYNTIKKVDLSELNNSKKTNNK